MKSLILLVTVLACLHCTAKEPDPEQRFREGIDKVQADFRKSFASEILKADKAIIYIVKFDGIQEGDDFIQESKFIPIRPYQAKTAILVTKELGAEEKALVLPALSKQIGIEEHAGGAFCHEPIHGLRLYKGGRIILESTFCWGCGNFGFKYPSGSDWLDTSAEIEAIFNKLLPIPKAELDRFYKVHPGLKPKE